MLSHYKEQSGFWRSEQAGVPVLLKLFAGCRGFVAFGVVPWLCVDG